MIGKVNKFNFLFIIFFFFNYFQVADSKSIYIKAKVQNAIITNLDIANEKKYLIFLNPRLAELEEKKVDEISKNSIIKEIIKKKELEKYHDFSKSSNFTKIVEKNLLKSKKLSQSEFLQIIKDEDLNYDVIIKKLEIEALWNQLIYKKYLNNIKINKKELKQDILNQFNREKEKFEFNLSEIVFVENVSENLQSLVDKIKKSINDIGFENTANIYSISSTSKNGGLIGWVNELQLSKKIYNKIYNLNAEELSDPIKIQGGFMIVKVNDKKIIKKKINLEEQLERLINLETNRQLNNFSIIFYKKLKKNIEIYEY